jgi:hypothetical protein
MVKVSDTGQVIYQSEKQVCRAFPDPKGNGMQQAKLSCSLYSAKGLLGFRVSASIASHMTIQS